MKVRTDFVSNSSSSSFIVALNKPLVKGREVETKVPCDEVDGIGGWRELFLYHSEGWWECKSFDKDKCCDSWYNCRTCDKFNDIDKSKCIDYEVGKKAIESGGTVAFGRIDRDKRGLVYDMDGEVIAEDESLQGVDG